MSKKTQPKAPATKAKKTRAPRAKKVANPPEIPQEARINLDEYKFSGSTPYVRFRKRMFIHFFQQAFTIEMGVRAYNSYMEKNGHPDRITRQAVKYWRGLVAGRPDQADPEFIRAFEDVHDIEGDFLENEMWKQVKEGNEKVMFKMLDARHSDRGYGKTRLEASGPDGGPMAFQGFKDAPFPIGYSFLPTAQTATVALRRDEGADEE